MLPLYAARIGDLGQGDFVKADAPPVATPPCSRRSSSYASGAALRRRCSTSKSGSGAGDAGRKGGRWFRSSGRGGAGEPASSPSRAVAPLRRRSGAGLRRPAVEQDGGTEDERAGENRGDTKRVEAHGKANIAASWTCARQPGRRRQSSHRRAAHRRNRAGRRRSGRRRERPGGQHSRS
jgi:hypothetical protein